jgi:hypothetical protein
MSTTSVGTGMLTVHVLSLVKNCRVWLTLLMTSTHVEEKHMRGSCLCRGVGYEVDRLQSAPRHCSCNTCRKAHAAAFNTSASVKLTEFRWLLGEQLLHSYESSPGKRRFFCGNCGSQLVAQREGSETLALRVATLDEDPDQRPAAHIWLGSEVPWLSYGSEIPSYQGWESHAL